MYCVRKTCFVYGKLCSVYGKLVLCTENDVLCTENYFLCTENNVLCTEHYVLCTENYVLCTENIVLCTENIVLCTENTFQNMIHTLEINPHIVDRGSNIVNNIKICIIQWTFQTNVFRKYFIIISNYLKNIVYIEMNILKNVIMYCRDLLRARAQRLLNPLNLILIWSAGLESPSASPERDGSDRQGWNFCAKTRSQRVWTEHRYSNSMINDTL